MVTLDTHDRPAETYREYQMTPRSVLRIKMMFVLVAFFLPYGGRFVARLFLDNLEAIEVPWWTMLPRVGLYSALLALVAFWQISRWLSKVSLRLSPDCIRLTSDGRKWRQIDFSPSVRVHEWHNSRGEISLIAVHDTITQRALGIRWFDLNEIHDLLVAWGIRPESLTRGKRWTARLSFRRTVAAIGISFVVVLITIWLGRALGIMASLIWLSAVASAPGVASQWKDEHAWGEKGYLYTFLLCLASVVFMSLAIYLAKANGISIP